MARASSAFFRSPGWRDLEILALASLVGMAAALVGSVVAQQWGFPLDDSWIHATYARNLALSARWVFRPGMVSAGSTSPLWTLLLVPGYWLGLAPIWWSHILGFGCLVGLGAAAEWGVRRLNEGYRPNLPWAGLLVCTEWHLIWAAASGMETPLDALCIAIVFVMLLTGSPNYAGMGLLTGLCVWIRPDALSIVPVALLFIALPQPDNSRRWRACLAYALGLGALLVPYVAFNLALSGTPLPNTFYAKQAEYSGWQARPAVLRIGAAILQMSTGPMLVLWPAVGIELARAVKARAGGVLLGTGWCAAFVGVYALRLPPYQHGRYLMPALPVLLVLGFLGLQRFVEDRRAGGKGWAVGWAWKVGLCLLQVGFIVMGAKAYGQDVALIQTEMVRTAQWVEIHLPKDAVVAAHDIGALGYFDDHPLIDLAGLVSPEVIPFVRDEARLASYLDQRGATYLIAFPELYPELASGSSIVFSSGGTIAPALGQGNMAVYCWRCR